MTLEVAPFPLPPSADAEMLKGFGRYVRSACELVVLSNMPHLPLNQRGERRSSRQTYARTIPGDPRSLVSGLCFHLRHRLMAFSLTDDQHGALLFRNVVVTPEEQYALTKVCI
jgi:hypothetical protein